MRFPGRPTAIRTLRWLRSRSQQRAMVLGYHRIGNPHGDGQGLSVSAARFAEQMDVLASVTRPVPLSDMVRMLARRTVHKNVVVVTFDDGYVDTLDLALPILEGVGIPAAVFVVSGYLGREFWWDGLERFLCLDHPRVEGAEFQQDRLQPHSSSRISRAAVQRTFTYHIAQLAARPDDERRSCLAALARKNGSPRPRQHRALSVDELVQLSRSELIEIGSHSMTHSVLTRLAEADVRRELEESRRTLEFILSSPVTSFSYPHGATSRGVTALVRRAGYSLACCSTPNVATPQSDPFALPRFWVGDWDGDRFERFLRRWLLA